ncbi:MAG: hypothetical protein ACE5GJ_04085 [Gemmatimonadota bacterium]
MEAVYPSVLLAAVVLVGGVWAFVLWTLIRGFARREESLRRHLAVELAWAVLPALLVVGTVLPALRR